MPSIRFEDLSKPPTPEELAAYSNFNPGEAWTLIYKDRIANYKAGRNPLADQIHSESYTWREDEDVTSDDIKEFDERPI